MLWKRGVEGLCAKWPGKRELARRGEAQGLCEKEQISVKGGQTGFELVKTSGTDERGAFR